MAVKTVTTYICDRCGRESDTYGFNDGYRSGSAKIDVEGNSGAQGLDGAWGGTRYHKETVICFSCADEFKALFENFMTKEQNKNEP